MLVIPGGYVFFFFWIALLGFPGFRAATMVGTMDKPNITPLRRNAKYSLAEVDSGYPWIGNFVEFHHAIFHLLLYYAVLYYFSKISSLNLLGGRLRLG